jgi:hypothetical protein
MPSRSASNAGIGWGVPLREHVPPDLHVMGGTVMRGRATSRLDARRLLNDRTMLRGDG